MRKTFCWSFLIGASLCAAWNSCLPFASSQERIASTANDSLRANAATVGVDFEKLSRATQALELLVENHKVAGAVIMVSRGGKIVLSDCVGIGRADSNRPMHMDSIFRIYSMTKAVTSVAAMQLVEHGDLELDAPVSKYIPEFASVKVYSDTKIDNDDARSASPTVRDLLRHTSGMTYGVFGDTPVDRIYRNAGLLARSDSNQRFVEKLGKIPLQYPPSSRFHYSVSVDVLGRLVEVVSGNPLDVQFEKAIFGPLGMTDTGFFVPEEKRDRLVDNFANREGGGLQVIELAASSHYLSNPTFLSGGGGLVSTASDYMCFCQMLCGLGERDGVRLLREDTVREMTRDQLPKGAFPIQVNGQTRSGVGFGLGFSVVVEPIPGFEYVPVGEYGWGGAASTHFWISPKHDLAVVVLTQHMPFTFQSESAVKPIIYEALR